MSANTQDLVVKACWVGGEERSTIVCEVEWGGYVQTLPLESILNEINKTAVFAHGYAQAAQAMAKGKT